MGRAGGSQRKRARMWLSIRSIWVATEARTACEVQITASQSITGAMRRSKKPCMMPMVEVVWVMPEMVQAAEPLSARRHASEAKLAAG